VIGRVLLGRPVGKDHLDDLGIDVKILKWFLTKLDAEV
jgi:hypothetical protein